MGTEGGTASGERRELLDAASLVEQWGETATAGDWQVRGLLATRPEVVACRSDGTTEHVAEARAASVRWITGLSPEVASSLVAWLRSAARDERRLDPAALSFARTILRRARQG